MTSGSQSPEPDVEWIGLSCVGCGHWKKGQFTKDQVAEWLRAHGAAQLRENEAQVTCASICPHPCGGVA